MNQIVMSLGMAFLLSVVTYLTKMQKGEGFDAYKFLRTLVIGAVIGGVAWQQHIQITGENWESYITANAGVIAFIDQGFKLIWRLVSGKESA